MNKKSCIACIGYTGLNLVVASVLTACGGGGSHGGGDNVAPQVSSITPASAATGVDTAAAVVAGFDEDIFAVTVDNSSFVLRNGLGPVAGSVSFDGVNNIASFTPTHALGLLSDYTITLTTAVTDLAGNPLAGDYTSAFTTRDGAWGMAGLVETDNAGDASQPQIGVDANGNAIAVWYQDDGTRNNIWSSRYAPGSGWSVPELVETDNAGDAYAPQISVDANGNAVAVWHQDDGTRYNILSNRYTAGSGWGTAELIESDNAGDAQFPQVSVNSSGHAIAVWQQDNGSGYNIWSNRYIPGSGWGTAELVETATGTTTPPDVGMDANGHAIAVWSQHDGTRYNVVANVYTAGAGWGAATLIEASNNGAPHGFSPRIAVNQSGNAVAVWFQSDGTRQSIYANRYTAGSGWGAEQLIESDNTGNAYAPKVIINENDDAIAVWHQYDGTSYNIKANSYASGGGWGTETAIDNSTANGYYPEVAMDASGHALVVWYQNDGIADSIWANRFIAGAGWGTATLIETEGPGDAVEPVIAMNGKGHAVATWSQSDSTRYNIRANLFH